MMTLALYALGVLVILVLAKYNESNKLFWTFLTAWTLGYAVTTMVVRSTKQSESKCVQVLPTQDAVLNLPGTFMMLPIDTTTAPKKETSEPVSQALVPVIANGFTTVDVTNASRDQPTTHVLPNPPTPYDTS